jgi:hypothetical protein
VFFPDINNLFKFNSQAASQQQFKSGAFFVQHVVWFAPLLLTASLVVQIHKRHAFPAIDQK